MSLELLLEVFHHGNVMVSTELRAGCLLFWLQVEPWLLTRPKRREKDMSS